MSMVLPAEASFLLLTARRTLNFQKKAEAQGEEYHDLQPMVDLQCGYAAKLRFVKGPSGETRPVVAVARASVQHAIVFSAASRMQVASEILGGPVVLMDETVNSDKQTFFLEKDK